MYYTRLLSFSPLPLHKSLQLNSKPNSYHLKKLNQKLKMVKGVGFLLLLLILCHGVVMAMGYKGDKEWRKGSGRWEEPREEEMEEPREEEMEEPTEEERYEREGKGEDLFLFPRSKSIIKTDAGEMRLVRGLGRKIIEKPLHIGFISMQPKTLFVPQYLDSNLILFVRTGEARVGCIYKDKMVERRMKVGDVFQILPGSTFYILNPAEGQRLHIICCIDTSESLQWDTFQNFFIGGGNYPTSILAGFGPETLSTAFNVSSSKLRAILSKQQQGPFLYLNGSQAPRLWSRFSQLDEQDRLKHVKRIMIQEEPHQEDEEKQTRWNWRKLFSSLFTSEDSKFKFGKDAPDSYNIYNKRKPDFKNNYGWSFFLDESEYKPLRHSSIGIYLVNLTAGAMMAPHVNPKAAEIGIVLRGTGRIQIVYPNGTLALDAKVKEGDVFWVPRYFAFCQIAARTGPFVFFGFTTSSQKNWPQFLAGRYSILRALNTPELAASFGVSEGRIKHLTHPQGEAVILPSTAVAPPEEKKGPGDTEPMPEMMKNFDEILGFD